MFEDIIYEMNFANLLKFYEIANDNDRKLLYPILRNAVMGSNDSQIEEMRGLKVILPNGDTMPVEQYIKIIQEDYSGDEI